MNLQYASLDDAIDFIATVEGHLDDFQIKTALINALTEIKELERRVRVLENK